MAFISLGSFMLSRNPRLSYFSPCDNMISDPISQETPQGQQAGDVSPIGSPTPPPSPRPPPRNSPQNQSNAQVEGWGEGQGQSQGQQTRMDSLIARWAESEVGRDQTPEPSPPVPKSPVRNSQHTLRLPRLY